MGGLKVNHTLQQILFELKEIKEKQHEHSQDFKTLTALTMENTRFITALSQDVARTATRDSIISLDSKFNLLNDRLFQTENKINLLSIVK